VFDCECSIVDSLGKSGRDSKFIIQKGFDE